MQNTRAMICYYTSIRMAKIKMATPTNAKDMEKLDHCHVECKNGPVTLETVWQFLKMLRMQLPNNLVTALLGTNPREMKAYFHTKICIQVFIAHLLVTIKKGK